MKSLNNQDNTTETASWYAMSAAGKMGYTLKVLAQRGIYSWAPFYKNPVDDRSLMPLIFFIATETEVRQMRDDTLLSAYIYPELGAAEWTPTTVDAVQVRRFKTLREMDDGKSRYFADPKRILEKGKPVRVTGGMFKGMEGYVCRVKGNTSLYIHIPRICVVSVAYIPKAYLENFSELRSKERDTTNEQSAKERLIVDISARYNTLLYKDLNTDNLNLVLSDEDLAKRSAALKELKTLCEQNQINKSDLFLLPDVEGRV